MKKRTVDGGIDLPIGEMKFDAHAAWSSDEHSYEFSRLLDDLEENCFACTSRLQRGILRTSLAPLGARAPNLAEEYDVIR